MTEETKKPAMEYRYLGKTGLKVSVLSFGNMVSSIQEDSQKLMTESVKHCLDYGINFFDTAELYGFGECEILLGQAFKDLKVPREQIVVTTKLYHFPGGKTMAEQFAYYKKQGCNGVGLNRKKIIEGAKASLKRLQLDYVDIIFGHRPDYETPLEETCRAFSWLIDKGLALYWGTSEWEPEYITEAIQYCRAHGLHEPVTEQCQYNAMFRNRFEKEYRIIFERFGYGSTIWSPLAQGFLSGKYNDGNIPEDTRFDKWDPFWSAVISNAYFGPKAKENVMRIGQGLAEIAKEIGCTQAQLALAWAISNKDVSSCILGFSKLSQLDENVKALDVYRKWNKDLEERIEKLLNNTPEPMMNNKIFAPFPQRRTVAVFQKKLL